MSAYRSKLWTMLLLSFVIIPAGCAGRTRPGSEGLPVIRVRLAAGADQVAIATNQPAVFASSGEGSSRRLTFPDGQPVAIALEGSQWRVGTVTFPGGELTVVPDVDGSMQVNGALYRGKFKLVPTGSGKFDVVNHVDAESYLLGVLASELFKDWNIEAFKAQAIVARTYGLYEAKTQGTGKHWDVWADTRSQVYGGVKAETDKAAEAVDATRGIVAAWGKNGDEKIFKAYFSACCGGVGQNAYDAFGDQYIPPLSERNVGGLCNISPRHSWAPVTIDKNELTRRVRTWGTTRGHAVARMQGLDRIDVEYVNRFGRPVRFIITDVSGQKFSLGSEETRWACNADRGSGPQLLSSFFKPVNQPTDIVFADGHGFGHGVGMCQWCAEAMARRGIPAVEIVRYSYPKAVLVKAY